jgi:hypothetical protein
VLQIPFLKIVSLFSFWIHKSILPLLNQITAYNIKTISFLQSDRNVIPIFKLGGFSTPV